MIQGSHQASWSALRSLQERIIVLATMEAEHQSEGALDEAARISIAKRQLGRQVEMLHELLEQGPEPVE